MIHRKLTSLSLLALLIVGSLVFFMVTDPQSVPPGVLIAAFGLILGICYLSLRLVFDFIGDKSAFMVRHRRTLLWGGAGLPVLVLVLQSIGQLTPRDLLTLLALFVAGSFYMTRLRVS